jgi:hypothetical protein
MYLMAIWYFCAHFGMFFPFWFVLRRKIWQPCFKFHSDTEELPDGLFSNQKSKFGEILAVLSMEDAGYCIAIWSIFLPFGIFCGHLVYVFPPVWYIVPRKIWQS